MRKIFTGAAAFLFTVFISSVSAQAQSESADAAKVQMVTASNPQSVADAMINAGYKAKITTDNIGDPMIETGMGGWKVSVLFYDCTENRECQSLQFYVIFDRAQPMPAEMVLAWSADNRFGSVSLDDDGDPSLSWDVVTGDAGIPLSVFEAVLTNYDNIISRFSNVVFE